MYIHIGSCCIPSRASDDFCASCSAWKRRPERRRPRVNPTQGYSLFREQERQEGSCLMPSRVSAWLTRRGGDRQEYALFRKQERDDRVLLYPTVIPHARRTFVVPLVGPEQ